MSQRSRVRSLFRRFTTLKHPKRGPSYQRRLRCEELERRELLAASIAEPLHFDFGPSWTAAQQGYTQVGLVHYNHDRGFGWSDLTGMVERDRGTSDLLTGTILYGRHSSFIVDLPDGTYDVTPTLGDAVWHRDNMNVWIEGRKVATALETPYTEFINPTYRVNVTGGRMNLTIRDTGGENPNFSIAALDIVPAAETSPSTPTADAGGSRTGTAGLPVAFAGAVTGGVGSFSYSWSFGDGQTASGSLTPQHTYATSGIYNATLTVTDALGLTSQDSATVTVDSTNTTSAGALYVSTHGSDGNNGRSAAAPLRSINTALGRLQPGMTLYIEGGTYHERMVMQVAGTAAAPITVTSYNGTAVIDGSGTTQFFDGSGKVDQNKGLVEMNKNYVTLDGLKIVNAPNTGVLLNADHITVQNCDISLSKRHAIATHTSRQTNYPGHPEWTMIRDVTIKDNVVYRNTLLGRGYGQAISLIADGFTVSGNTLHHNVVEGIDIWLGAKHGDVFGNTIYDNGDTGIFVDGASYVRIYDNKVSNSQKGIGVSSESQYYATNHIQVFNNVVTDNSSSGIFIWDDANAGFAGSQNVLIANNTLVNNRTNIYLAGSHNTAEIMNNLGYTSGSAIYSSATNSSFNTHNNVWLSSLSGFVSPANGDFRLTSASQAIGKGSTPPTFSDDLGNRYSITTDMSGVARTVGGSTDVGAFEYRP